VAYIDYAYYTEHHGGPVPESDFNSLSGPASDVVDQLITVPIDPATVPDAIKKATAYQIDMLYAHGGMDAFGEMGVTSESLGAYSVSQTAPASRIGGVPVSSMAIGALTLAGYRQRWL
jgi:hypothetical protein